MWVEISLHQHITNIAKIITVIMCVDGTFKICLRKVLFTCDVF